MKIPKSGVCFRVHPCKRIKFLNPQNFFTFIKLEYQILLKKSEVFFLFKYVSSPCNIGMFCF